MQNTFDPVLQTMTINDLNRKFCSQNNFLLPLSINYTHITGLCLYPVKGCKGFSVDKWPITEYGMYLDRHWCIYSSKIGKYINIEKCPDPLVIHTFIDMENKLLILASYNMNKNFILPIRENEFSNSDDPNLISLKVVGKKTKNIFQDCGENAASWLNECLKRDDCRLLRQTQLIEGNLSLVQSHLQLVNRKSLEDLADKIGEEQGYFTTDLEELCWKFRSNIIISGIDAYQENKWKHILIKETKLEVEQLCERCKAINVDESRLDYEKYPLKYLLKMGNGKAYFGLLIVVRDVKFGEFLSVGDAIVMQ